MPERRLSPITIFVVPLLAALGIFLLADLWPDPRNPFLGLADWFGALALIAALMVYLSIPLAAGAVALSFLIPRGRARDAVHAFLVFWTVALVRGFVWFFQHMDRILPW